MQALCWSRPHQQACYYSSPLRLSRHCPLLCLSFCLKLSGTSRKNCLLSHLLRNECTETPAINSLSSLIFRIHSCLFSDWRRTVLSTFFGPQVPSVSAEELVFPRHARRVLARLHCNGHSLLLNCYISRIGRIENRSCSTCGYFSSRSALSRCGLVSPLALWRLFSLSTTSGLGPGE